MAASAMAAGEVCWHTMPIQLSAHTSWCCHKNITSSIHRFYQTQDASRVYSSYVFQILVVEGFICSGIWCANGHAHVVDAPAYLGYVRGER